MKINVVIVGAGAAGLMCAIEAAKRGRKVLVVDHANKAGKKILMSGGGRCNFTNIHTTAAQFISHNPHFCKSALSRYTPDDFIKLVTQYNIPFHEKKLGQLFCDHKSKAILDMLLSECQHYGVTIKLDTSITKIATPAANQFIVDTTNTRIECESLVIASGGLSIPTLGATAFGYKVAAQFNIKVWPTRAGLVPFTLHEADKEKFSALPGIAVDCIASCNNQAFTEALLFTHRGLSGPAMLQISSYWHAGDTLLIEMIPEVALYTAMKHVQKMKGSVTLKNFLVAHLPNRLVTTWLTPDEAATTIQSCSDEQLQTIANLFQQWRIKPNNTEGYRTAEVTLGGVDCNAISSKTFEANNTPGLYFIGEVLDVTGWLGGYNFQWAWASGFVAGGVV